jgi:hypothetical protein
MLLDIAESGLSETFCGAGGTTGTKKLVTADKKPLRSFKPPLGRKVAIPVLPYKLGRKHNSWYTMWAVRRNPP